MKQLGKRMFSLVLAGLLIVGLLPAQALGAVGSNSVANSTNVSASTSVQQDAEAGGSAQGTKENPYKLSTPEDLELLRQYPNSYFVLTTNLDLQDVSFVPVAEPFTGTLDGMGYAIRNLEITTEQAALFVSIAYASSSEVGIVRNLAFETPKIYGTSAAAVVALRNEGYLSNVRIVGGSVTAAGDTGLAGALTATNAPSGIVQKSGSNATVSATNAGGLIGTVEGGTVRSCFAGGKVTRTGKNGLAGSVAGSVTANSITASGVYYIPKDTGFLEAAQTKNGEYTNAGFVAVVLRAPESLTTGEENARPVIFDTEPTGNAITYGSSDEAGLSVNSETGAYTLLTQAGGLYQVNFTFDKYFTHTASLAMPSTGEAAASQPSSGSVESESVPNSEAASGSASATQSASTSDSTAPESSTASQSGSLSSSVSGTTSVSEAGSASDSTSGSAVGSESGVASGSNSASTSGSASHSVSSSGASSSDGSLAPSQSSSAAASASGSDSESGSVSSDSVPTSGATSDSVSGSTSSSAVASASQSTSAAQSESASGSDSTSSSQVTQPLPKDPEISNTVVEGTWITQDKQTHFIYNDGTKATGHKKIEDAWYVFDANGILQPYTYTDGTNWYFASSTGLLYLNSLVTGGGVSTWYGEDGAARPGWQTREGEKIYQIPNATMRHQLAVGVVEIDGALYLFDANGAQKTGTGWVEGVYLKNDRVLTDRQVIDGKTYILQKNGRPYTGEFVYAGASYSASESGALYLGGFRKLADGTLRYYDAAGQAPTGWFTHENGRYYQTPSLQLLTGQQTVDGAAYFFGSNGRVSEGDGWAGDYYLQNGKPLVGKHDLDGKTYVFAATGLVQKGAFDFEGVAYCGDDTGALYKNAIARPQDAPAVYYGPDGTAPKSVWVEVDGGRYYQTDKGTLATGRHTVEGTVYYFAADGQVKTDGNGWAGLYYLENGAPVTGPKIIEGKQYVFDKDGLAYTGEFMYNNLPYAADAAGVLYTDTVRSLAGGKYRYYGLDGAATTGWVTKAGTKMYYQGKDFVLVTGAQTIDKVEYQFLASGRLVDGSWVGERYIKQGAPVTGRQTIDGVKYIFSNLGIPFKFEFNYEGEKYFASGTGALYSSTLLTRNGKMTYYDENGAARKGWIDQPGIGKYYQNDQYNLMVGAQEINGVLYFFGSNGVLSEQDGWAGEYYVVNKKALTGLQTIDGKSYIFAENGLLQRGEITFKGANYFADKTGALTIGATAPTANGALRYYGVDGIAKAGWFELAGVRHYQTPQLTVATGKQTIEGAVHFFTAEGALRTDDGWAGDYYLKNGEALTGKQQIDASTYIFNDEGVVQKGVISFESYTYHGDAKTGALALSAIVKLPDGKLRYLGADGIAAQGWVDANGNRYYQSNALVLLTGRQTIEGKQYFFGQDGVQKAGNGWTDDYYLLNGNVVSGIQNIDGNDYIFNAQGKVQKGSYQYNGGWYFGTQTGAVAKHTVQNIGNGVLRYFGADGRAVAGWAQIGQARYYQNNSLSIVTGKQTVDGKLYFFGADGKLRTQDGWVDGLYTKGGLILTGKQTIGGRMYIFAANGQVQKGEIKHANERYYANSAGALQTNYTQVRGNNTLTYYGADGVARKGWMTAPNGNRLYQVEKNGAYVLSTGFVTIGGEVYYFDAVGAMFQGKTTGWYVVGNKQYYFLTDGRFVASPNIAGVDTAFDAGRNVYTVTVRYSVSKTGGQHPNGSVSFDGGATWQSGTTFEAPAAQGVNLAAGQIRVRDAVGQSIMHTQSVYLAPIKPEVPNAPAGTRGIDVSMYNKNINWTQVAQSGINFVLVRASSYNNAYGGYYMDPYFEANVRGAKAAGLNVGAYLFSYATSISDIQTEVNFFLNSKELRNLNASGIRFDYPVYIDYESTLNLNGTTYNGRTDIVRTGMQMLEKAGYYPGFYTYHSYRNHFNVAGLVSEGYEFWYARYPASPNPDANPSGSLGINVGIWQYCSDGNTNPAMKPYVNGITTSLDLNVTYKDYPSFVRPFNTRR